MLYKLDKVKRVHGGRAIVDIEKLELEAGRIYALTGPNGAGKTTLLQMLAFLDSPDTGTIEFAGKPVMHSETKLQPLRRRVILVDQQPLLFSMSVFANVEIPLKLRNIPVAERKVMIEEVLRRVDMLAFADAMGSRLSGGEIQRVALARALVCRPEVLLLDEPTSNIDQRHQPVIEGLIRSARACDKISVVFSTHSLPLVDKLADSCLHMDNGKISER
ncbi:MAG TPA: phosphate ABC transporter ATP-binding protein [Candidatus Riflebacteria bacterium]|nr:phosphate ABC transporter ATP-binding protein [Candidatus Riflebacteria bacterium]